MWALTLQSYSSAESWQYLKFLYSVSLSDLSVSTCNKEKFLCATMGKGFGKQATPVEEINFE